MTLLGCDHVQDRLEAFHDGELPVDERLEVSVHLDMCPRCRAMLAQARALGIALRETTAARDTVDRERLTALAAGVVSRAGAERRVSWGVRVREMFEDLHMVLSGAAALVAVFTCVAVGSSLLRAVTAERADSLAGLLAALAEPGASEAPIALGLRVRAPDFLAGAYKDVVAQTSAEESDNVFALAASVTRDGRIVNPDALMANQKDHELVMGLLDAINRARFDPVRLVGEPGAVNLVWLFTHSTGRVRKA